MYRSCEVLGFRSVPSAKGYYTVFCCSITPNDHITGCESLTAFSKVVPVVGKTVVVHTFKSKDGNYISFLK